MSRGSARTPRRAVLAAVLLAAACVSPKAHVRRALDELVRSEALAGGRIGVVVADIASGEVLAEHDGHRGFATASNMKLLSSAVALQTLGPDYTTSTELLMVGEVEGGTLHGDLLLRGHGDPTFGDAGVDAFVAAVRAAGIERVDGSIRGDGSWLGREQRGEGWQWDYLDAGYAAPFGGLCVDQSCVEVRVRPAGGAVAVECRPSTGRAPVVGVELLPAGAASRITAERAPGSDRIAVHGTIAADSAPVAVRVAVADSARFAAEVFAERLRGAGVAVGSAPAVAALGPERLLAQHDSPPLAAIVRPLLTDSNNLYAEQVWRLAARQACGSGDTAAAAWHATELFEALDIDTRGMVLADGSGLSRRNLVQPHQLAAVLLWADRAPFGETFRRSLPLAGRSGTLRTRFRGGPAQDRVRAKTGYIARVVCLSGYVPRPPRGGDGDAGVGDRSDAPALAFCVMLNDFTCPSAEAKAAVDRFVEELCRSVGWR